MTARSNNSAKSKEQLQRKEHGAITGQNATIFSQLAIVRSRRQGLDLGGHHGSSSAQLVAASRGPGILVLRCLKGKSLEMRMPDPSP